MIDFAEIQKQLFTTAEAMQYLGIEKRSMLDNLIRTGRITPIKIGKENRFARSDLDAMIQRELEEARRLQSNCAEISS